MNWFNKLTSQEQKLIKLGLIIILPILIWTLVYQPMNKSIESKSKQKNQLEIQYQEMLLSENLLKTKQETDHKFHRDLNKPFIQWIDNQLTKNQLSQYLTRSEPKDSQTLILSFEGVVFDELVKWLEPLEFNFGVVISEVDINLTDRDNGLCNARITLEENK